MNSQKSVVVSGGVTTTGLLGISFIVLKLIGVINWSWWWVLAPFWIPLGVSILGIIIALVLLGIVSLLE